MFPSLLECPFLVSVQDTPLWPHHPPSSSRACPGHTFCVAHGAGSPRTCGHRRHAGPPPPWRWLPGLRSCRDQAGTRRVCAVHRYRSLLDSLHLAGTDGLWDLKTSKTIYCNKFRVRWVRVHPAWLCCSERGVGDRSRCDVTPSRPCAVSCVSSVEETIYIFIGLREKARRGERDKYP